MLAPGDLAQLPTWVSGVRTPFGGLVKFFFRRHLERAAAQKHGSAGMDAARQKQAERKEKRVQSKVDKKQSATAQLDELLKAHGVAAGYAALHLLGPSLAHAVRVFVDPKTAGKKRRGRGCVSTAARALTARALTTSLAQRRAGGGAARAHHFRAGGGCVLPHENCCACC